MIACAEHEAMIAVRVVVVPLLFLLYIFVGVPLVVRNIAHVACVMFDSLFDKLARLAGWNPDYWPVPKASDDPLPLRNVP